MNVTPFPANSAEFEEYREIMDSMADEAEATVPDPTEYYGRFSAREVERGDRAYDELVDREFEGHDDSRGDEGYANESDWWFTTP